MVSALHRMTGLSMALYSFDSSKGSYCVIEKAGPGAESAFKSELNEDHLSEFCRAGSDLLCVYSENTAVLCELPSVEADASSAGISIEDYTSLKNHYAGLIDSSIRLYEKGRLQTGHRDKGPGFSEVNDPGRGRKLDRYNLALSGAGQGIWQWNTAEHKIYISDLVADFTGLPASFDDSMNNLADLIHAYDIDRFHNYVRSFLFNKKRQFSIELRVRHFKGDWRWCSVKGRRIDLDNGDVVIAGMFQDITGKRSLEADLLQEREFLETLLQSIPVGLTVSKKDTGELLMLNRQFRTMVGLSDDENIDRETLLEIIYPDPGYRYRILRQWQKDLEEARAGQAVPVRTVTMTTRKGIKRSIQLSVSILSNSYILGVYVDVTERIKSQQLVIRQLSQLLDNHNELEAIFQSSPLGLLFLKSRRMIEQVNPRLCRMLGYSRSELIGQSTEKLHISRESFEYFGAMYYDALQKSEQIHIRYPFKTKDNRLIWCEVSGSLLKQSDPSQGAVWFIDDITRQQQYEAELKDARRRAEEASRVKGMFLANISHEIRTPINAILGFSELLSKNSDDIPYYAKAIRESGEMLLLLINDLLDFSKIESDRLHLTIEPVDVVGHVKKIMQQYKFQADEKNISLKLKTGSETIRLLKTDGMRLTQILSNLLSNALKFTEKGDVTVEVYTVKPDAEPANLVIAVHDSGVGIDSAYLEKIFEPFEQIESHDARQWGGTGLGLAISKNLARLIGGNLFVCSEKSRGSVFALVLFNCEWGTESGSGVPESPLISPVVKRLKKSRVVLIDDAYWNRELMKEFLADEPVILYSTDNGLEGVEMIRNEKPDLVLLDLRMPGISGRDVLKIIREDNETASIPVICVSASGVAEPEQMKRIKKEFNGFLEKPVSKNELISALYEFLGGCEVEINTEDIVYGDTLPDAEIRLLKDEIKDFVDIVGRTTDFEKIIMYSEKLSNAAEECKAVHLAAKANEVRTSARHFRVSSIQKTVSVLSEKLKRLDDE